MRAAHFAPRVSASMEPGRETCRRAIRWAGSAVFVNTLELRLPPPTLPYVGDSVSFVLFHDMGNVFQNAGRHVSELPPVSGSQTRVPAGMCRETIGTCNFNYFSHAVGLGARYKTPVGPIRVDFSYNLNPPVYPVIYDFNSNPPHVGAGEPLQLLLQHWTELLDAWDGDTDRRMWRGALSGDGCCADGRMGLLPLRRCGAAAGAPAAASVLSLALLLAQGTVLDRVVAVVNGDVILESDVDEERRFEQIQPYRRIAAEFSREQAIERLIDRTLILQQAQLEPEDAISDEALDAQLATLRKDIPECKQYHCETDAGWQKFLADHGFTVEEFRERWRQRMELLRFIEVRFRNGIRISDDEIKAYYEKTMLPEYAKQHVTPPKLETISKRIEEVLLQQQVSNLLQDWLKSLRAQGSVRMMNPGEVAP